MADTKETKSADVPVDAGASLARPMKMLMGVVALNLLATGGLAAFLVLRPPSAAAPVVPHAAAGDAAKEKHEEEDGAKEGAKEDAKTDAKPAAEETKEGDKPKEGEGHAKTSAEKSAESKPSKASEGSGDAGTARLEDIVVHLRNPEVDRYARLTIDVETANPDDLSKLQARAPQIRDAVITYMSERTFEELRGAEGLQRVKSALRERIDNVTPFDISAVYISAFVVQ